MSDALLVIDVQNDYFPGGKMELTEPEAAEANVYRLLDTFRADDRAIIHFQHIWDEPDALYFQPGTLGVEIRDLVQPAPGERLIQKTFPNAFQETELHETLQRLGVTHIFIAGMMTQLCIDATARAASDLGYSVTIAHDACDAPTLTFGARIVTGPDVHAAFMATLGDGYAEIISTAELIGE